ncbi:nitroreductase [hydrocarbon metagenome]|uniref:Nitroreductase n=1 Tax=hydrocarbon metagenome TaxID=938273 RepID=A0A0W8E168_9ZZZZ
MDTMTCIKNRRSVRRFTEQEVPDEILDELLEAVRWAPSWHNTQCWEVVVVRGKENKEAIIEQLTPGNPSAKGVRQAPVVLVFCARTGVSGYIKGNPQTIKGDWCMFDMGIAGQSFCLAAHARGLGTVHIGAFDHKEVDRILGLPEEVESVEIIPLGYPAQAGVKPARKERHQFVHYEKYADKP